MKKLVSLLLSVLLAFCAIPSISFDASVLNQKNENTYMVNHVWAKDIKKDGTNLTSDQTDGEGREVQRKKIYVTQDDKANVQVSFDYLGETTTIIGIPVAKSPDKRTIFFKAQSVNKDLKVVYFSISYNIESTNRYFKNTNKEKEEDIVSIFQLYLRDTKSKTRDYHLFEGNNIVLDFSEKIINNLEESTIYGAWAASEFEPIDSIIGEEINSEKTPSLRALTNTKYWYCTKTYYEMGERQTHTIKWRTHIDYSNVPVGQEATQYYRFEITEKSMNFSVNTSFNSTSESYLHIKNLNLEQISVGNTAWKSTMIDGYVFDNSWWGSPLSADISVGYGALGLTLSFPISFSGSNYVDINIPYTGYVNGINNNYTRAIRTEMDSDFMLTEIGHFFEVASVLRDYGNVSSGYSLMKACWNVKIINYGNMSEYNYTCSHNVNIAVS
ncbi:MAG: hypothetical protein IK138_00815 [Lachnospiraceae bacterium]|nr:hypothetical protein [Lachnospiraceae bacterium]